MASLLGLNHCLPKKVQFPEVLPPQPRPSGLTLRWKYSGSPPATAYGVSWRAASWWTSNSLQVPATQDEVQELHISDVAPDETVRVWVYTVTAEKGSSPFCPPWEFTRPNDIFTAVFEGDLERCKSALAEAQGTDESLLTTRDVDGNTLSHWAALRGHKDILEWLGEHKVPLTETVDPDDMIPMHWSCVQSRVTHPPQEDLLACVKFLIAQGSDINQVTKKRRSALVLAIQSNLLEIARHLIEQGIDLELPDTMGDTAMHWSAYYGSTDMIKDLHGKGLSISAQDSTGQTPLHLAATRGNIVATRFLAEQGGLELLEMQDNDGKTAYDLAFQKDIMAVYQLLRNEKRKYEKSGAAAGSRVVPEEGGVSNLTVDDVSVGDAVSATADDVTVTTETDEVARDAEVEGEAEGEVGEEGAVAEEAAAEPAVEGEAAPEEPAAEEPKEETLEAEVPAEEEK